MRARNGRRRLTRCESDEIVGQAIEEQFEPMTVFGVVAY